MKFTELNLKDGVLQAIDMMGYTEATPIQEQAIPEILARRDLIACAQTGTGKTAAYVIPTIQQLMGEPSDHINALVLVPTRELAEQIDQNIEGLSYFTGVSSTSVIGGKDSSNWDRQKYALTHGVDILVATPGRLIMHMALGYVDFSKVQTVILDEADKMLDMGFYGDIIQIINQVNKDRQTLLFSATMPKKIRQLAKEIMKDPAEISLQLAKPAEGIKQEAFVLYQDQKIPILEHIVKNREVDSMIIFASSKISVDKIQRRLKKLGYDVKAMHSDKDQSERQATLREFKNKQFRFLVGTDVLARGIDIDNLSHVLNFDVPLDAEDYVHRVGRTARASSTGEAITFIVPDDMYRFADIERLIEREVPKGDVPDELGPTPKYDPKSGRFNKGRRGGGRGSKGGGRGFKGRKGKSGGNHRHSKSGKRHNHGEHQGQDGGDREGKPKKKKRRNRNRRRGGKNKGSGPESSGQKGKQD